ncbi:DUF2157 domain-containing protein [Parerythrobacter aurantius]|uniref:DUF2157 domain-containing protein n=1 Tax=Parerythrobacter aurantius TaxID=3127706 RepID=UPI00324536AA
MLTRKLEAWLAAGLIDEATQSRIVAYEAEHARPLALWAVIGIGVLALALGILSVVAANWEDVPGRIRLAIHLGLIATVATTLMLRGERLEREHPWALEAALFVLGVLGLTFFGHLGQVYQTDSPLWRPLAAWLVLFAPVLLLRGQSWIVALGLMAAAIGTVWEYSSTLAQWTPMGEPDAPWLWMSLVTALPVLIAPCAAWMRRHSARDAFWTRMEQLAIAYAMVGASLLCIVASIGEVERGMLAIGSQALRAAIALVAAGLVALLHRSRSGSAAGAVLAACGVTAVLAYLFNDRDIMAGLLFMALWAAVGAAALYAGWRGVFQLAVAAVALRLIVLSFELASDLLTSGFGLIVAGLMILGVAWGAVKVSRTFAPPKRDGGEGAA